MPPRPAHPHIHRLIAFRRFSPYEVLSIVFSVVGLVSLYLLVEQIRVANVQNQHLARQVETGAYQSVANELLELHKLYLEHPELRPYFRGGRDIRPDDPNYPKALVLAEYQLDFFDSFWMQSQQMPQLLDRRGRAWGAWTAYMQDSFSMSPVMCRHLDSVKSWYTSDFVAFARQSCPKGTMAEVIDSATR
jgi:hypothetical protein